jgi:hypothetical protein
VCWKSCSSCWCLHLLREEFLSAPIHSPLSGSPYRSFITPLLQHSILTLLLEAKVTLVTISPTIVTMKLHELRFRLRLGLLTWFLPIRLLNWFLLSWPLNRFLLTRLLTFSPKNTFPNVLLNLISFWKSSLKCGNMEDLGLCRVCFVVGWV